MVHHFNIQLQRRSFAVTADCHAAYPGSREQPHEPAGCDPVKVLDQHGVDITDTIDDDLMLEIADACIEQWGG